MCKDGIRVVIADDEPITRMDLKELLAEEGLPLLDGLSAAKIVYEENLADTVMMLTAYSEREFVDQAKDIGVAGYLVKPIDEKSLIPSIELAVARSKDMKKLRKDMQKVSERLENRSIIEKAKGQVMAQEGMNEQDAYDYIRKLSQTKNLSMRRVAEIILMKSGGQ